MWSPTLDEDGKVGGAAARIYKWATKDGEDYRVFPSYAKGDCNNLTDQDIVDYPACQACRNLDYAGFSEGWYLPSQRKGVLIENCNIACGRDGDYFYAPGRQLWDFGAEQCPHWGTKPYDESQGACSYASGHIIWDDKAIGSLYWSSTQFSETYAWGVEFSTAGARYSFNKSTSQYVRCVLGEYNK